MEEKDAQVRSRIIMMIVYGGEKQRPEEEGGEIKIRSMMERVRGDTKWSRSDFDGRKE